jgi:hypothetical protein
MCCTVLQYRFLLIGRVGRIPPVPTDTPPRKDPVSLLMSQVEEFAGEATRLDLFLECAVKYSRLIISTRREDAL